MDKFKKWLYVVIVAIWPVVYMMGFSYLRREWNILLSRTFMPHWTSYIQVSYVVAGVLFAYVAFAKKEYYKDKSVLIAHIIAGATTLLFFVARFVIMDCYLNNTFVFYYVMPNVLNLFDNPQENMFTLGFVIVTTIRAIYLYCKKEPTKHLFNQKEAQNEQI